jgi:hypothetical protein
MAKSKVIIGNLPRVKIDISDRYTKRERISIASDIAAYLAERARKGLGKDAKPWTGKAAKYSDSYANSLDFKIAGKSKSKVDLTLSSEMLDSLDLKSESKGSITIAVDESQAGKAEGNIKGTYGQSSPIKGKQRNFLDLSRRELTAILSNYPLRDKKKREETVREVEQAQDRASELIDDLFFDDE